MANYYHEARAHARSVKNMSEDSRRRAERRAEMATIHVRVVLGLGSRITEYIGHESQEMRLHR